MVNLFKKEDICVYISGKYTGSCLREVEKHIRVAEEVAINLANNNIKYFCPHTHSNHMDFYTPDVPWKYWIDLDLHFLKTSCNCMLMLDNWRDSNGAIIEYGLANELDLPTFESFNDFMCWYKLL